MNKIWRIAGVVILAFLLAAPLTMAAMTLNQNNNLQLQQNNQIQLLPAKITFIHPSDFKKEGWDSHNGGYKIEWKYSGGRDGKLLKGTLVKLDLFKADGTWLKTIVNNLPIGNEGTESGGGGTGSYRMDCPNEIHGDYKFTIQSLAFADLIVTSNVVNIQYYVW